MNGELAHCSITFDRFEGAACVRTWSDFESVMDASWGTPFPYIFLRGDNPVWRNTKCFKQENECIIGFEKVLFCEQVCNSDPLRQSSEINQKSCKF